MTLVVFTNPRTSTTYTWVNNPLGAQEQPLVKQRQIERTSNTGNVGAVKQQGDDGPLILDWQIAVKTSAFELALWQWYVLSSTQTIYLTDWDSEQYEGQIIQLSRQRQASGGTRKEYSTYEFQFEIYRCISGILVTAGVTP